MTNRVLIGYCEFRCGGTVLDTTPVYTGESPDSDVIFNRAMSNVLWVHPAKQRLLFQAERRFYAARNVDIAPPPVG